jgi:hypothetical protein
MHGRLVELTRVLEEYPLVDVDGHTDSSGRTALNAACSGNHSECAQLLIDYNADVNNQSTSGVFILGVAAKKGYLGCVKLLVENGADVNCQSKSGWTPLMSSSLMGGLHITQYLVEQKADVNYRVLEEGDGQNKDALYCAMKKYATDRTPGFAFAILSCNTDARNVNIYEHVTATMRDGHIEKYKRVQGFIDEYHRILNFVLTHVRVDTRVGRCDSGIYHEPLERTLEYLGLSMSKDQVINTSIDGESVRRALIPSLHNANHWFKKYTSSHWFSKYLSSLDPPCTIANT